MPRPKANPDQNIRAYRLHKEGNGHTEITGKLRKEFGEKAVSERTIATWIKQFKLLDPETLDMDEPFAWSQMGRTEIPWEASSFIMDMLKRVHYLNASLAETYGSDNVVSVTTFREVQWWHRVHQATPEIPDKVGNLNDVQWIAAKFIYRELGLDLLSLPFDTVGLEAWLALKPWLDEEHDREYRRAVKLGVVPPLKEGPSPSVMLIAAHEKSLELQGGILFSVGDIDPERPYLLHSQQMARVQADPELQRESERISEEAGIFMRRGKQEVEDAERRAREGKEDQDDNA